MYAHPFPQPKNLLHCPPSFRPVRSPPRAHLHLFPHLLSTNSGLPASPSEHVALPELLTELHLTHTNFTSRLGKTRAIEY